MKTGNGTQTREIRIAYILLGSVIILWGSNWPIMKYGLNYVTPLWFSAGRVLTGSIAMCLVLLAMRRLRLPPRKDISVLLTVGLFQMAVPLFCVYTGLAYVEAGRGALLAYTTPLWVTPAAALFLGESLTFRKILGVSMGLAGIGVLFNPFSFDWTDGKVLIGNALLMGAAMSSSIPILHVRSHMWQGKPIDLILWQLLLAGVVLTVLAWIFDGPGKIQWSVPMVVIVTYNGAVATAFCYWATNMVLKSLPAITSSMGFLGVPAMSIIVSTAAFGEKLTPALVTGLALIVGGQAFVNLARERYPLEVNPR